MVPSATVSVSLTSQGRAGSRVRDEEIVRFSNRRTLVAVAASVTSDSLPLTMNLRAEDISSGCVPGNSGTEHST